MLIYIYLLKTTVYFMGFFLNTELLIINTCKFYRNIYMIKAEMITRIDLG